MNSTPITSPPTLEAFSARVGCHISTASRLRAGERLPSRELLARVVNVYGLNREDAFDAFTSGPDAFGSFLRDRVFTVTVDGAKEAVAS